MVAKGQMGSPWEMCDGYVDREEMWEEIIRTQRSSKMWTFI